MVEAMLEPDNREVNFEEIMAEEEIKGDVAEEIKEA